MSVALHLGDCREVMRGIADCSVDAIVTDPPYLINFMGHTWDRGDIAFDRDVWVEALRVLKPGGHVVAYGAARTYHWLACAVELAGFDIRDMVPWLQGQGMPHGLDVSKAIDKMAGVEREVVVRYSDNGRKVPKHQNTHGTWDGGAMVDITAPATPEAAQWAGWNTQLAPGHEPCVLARKPISEATVAANVLRWGTGGLNVDGCRLEGGKRDPGYADPTRGGTRRMEGYGNAGARKGSGLDPNVGRWPPNVTLSEAAASRLDAMVGKRKTGALPASTPQGRTGKISFGVRKGVTGKRDIEAKVSSPSEFFYCPKAATGERENGCEHLRWAKVGNDFVPWEPGMVLLVDKSGTPIGNPWPTVKPLALMRWLCRLVTQPGGTVLDPFHGSGSTGVAAISEGFDFVGIDKDPRARAIALARTAWAQGHGPALHDAPVGGPPVQGALFT